MSKMSRYPHDAKVYVGELGNNASKQDIEEAFGYYGPLRNVWVARNPPGFAFVEFEDARDAEDAVRGLDGRTISGRRARVELSTGRGGRGGGGGGRGGPPRGGGKGGGGGGGRFQSDDRCYECGGRGHFARDCSRRRGRKSRSPRSRSRELKTRSRSYSRSRSRSRERGSRTKTTPKRAGAQNHRSLSRGASKSPRRAVTRSPSRSRSRTPKRSVSRSQSRSMSRSRSRHRNGDHD
ncbi:serine/arginine-rich splicing factor 7 isoform X2 [Anopheles cruzii]|uniref:serine/arginine-rich splicing factor 7 isoform X2 n=1 Tax=Anopheles cruzii TaxID=68878 RepID=UPI0022EC5A2D|nr:serine/arginine-rich splicing factor 7 isoform X2 [Anopheles cruzii]